MAEFDSHGAENSLDSFVFCWEPELRERKRLHVVLPGKGKKPLGLIWIQCGTVSSFPSELGRGWQFLARETLPAFIWPSPETRSPTWNSWDTGAGISFPKRASQGVPSTAEPAFPHREGLGTAVTGRARGLSSPVPAVPGTPCGTFPWERRRDAPASPWRQRAQGDGVPPRAGRGARREL